ncbi:hypothetical protein [Roseovarius sp. TE539]|uniref:hypothetical protein n=1 Tax=Roseovarius sp. TE539 TaxID=2249812 RepID=UPI0015EE72A1|nr:hypothetical protein [Roseovarius sp. TE539]
MNSKTPRKKPAKKAGQTREDRLKQALKANLARRKVQTRARSGPKQGTGQDGQKES